MAPAAQQGMEGVLGTEHTRAHPGLPSSSLSSRRPGAAVQSRDPLSGHRTATALPRLQRAAPGEFALKSLAFPYYLTGKASQAQSWFQEEIKIPLRNDRYVKWPHHEHAASFMQGF